MRLIDADALLQEFNSTKLYKLTSKFEQMIRYAPTIDAVSVVRCRDCVFGNEDGRCEPITNGLVREYTKPNDFCSYGKRKENKNGLY